MTRPRTDARAPTRLLGLALLLFGAVPARELGAAAEAGAQTLSHETVAASHPAFRYLGRFDGAAADARQVVWQSSTVEVGFEGAHLAFLFSGAEKQAYFRAEVDGVDQVFRVPEGDLVRVAWSGPLGPGPHALRLTKRSEATAGTAWFRGIEIAPGASVRPPVPAAASLHLLFLGDSITAGACNEDGASDQWDDRRTHNALLSYAALTAASLGADLENISVSGMGIAAGYVEFTAADVWDRVRPAKDAPKADLGSFEPDIVFFNFGENDASFTRGRGTPFPGDFVARYEALVSSVRRQFPKAELVVLRGGMGGGATDPRLIAAWSEVVRQVEAADPRAAHYVFGHWTKLHPRVADDRAMAGELSAWLRAQPFVGASPRH